jgi:peptidoglycan/LPS O-acetylase OafA/YrhL
MPSFTENTKVPALTGIRFFAASYVFVMHYGATFLDRAGVPRPIATFLHNGIFGVSIFFVLSGFILSHAHPGQFAAPAQYRDYFVARVARIYPAYLFALLLALPIPLRSVPLTAGRATAVLALVQSWNDAYAHSGFAWIMQAWTLSVEMFFYLFFPFLINMLRRLASPVLWSLCLIDAAFMIGAGTATITPWTDYGGYTHLPAWPLHLLLPLTRSGEFVFGMVLQTLLARRDAGVGRTGGGLCLVLTAVIVALLSATRNDSVVTAATVLTGVLIGLIYVSDNGFTRVLGIRPLYVLGCASYALYLLQGPVHTYLRLAVSHPWDRLVAFPVALAASLLVWRFIEEPARRSILRLLPRPAAATAPAQARCALVGANRPACGSAVADAD